MWFATSVVGVCEQRLGQLVCAPAWFFTQGTLDGAMSVNNGDQRLGIAATSVVRGWAQHATGVKKCVAKELSRQNYI